MQQQLVDVQIFDAIQFELEREQVFEYEVNFENDEHFGYLYRIWKGFIKLGTLYFVASKQQWLADPYYSNGTYCYEDSTSFFKTFDAAIEYIVGRYEGKTKGEKSITLNFSNQ